MNTKFPLYQQDSNDIAGKMMSQLEPLRNSLEKAQQMENLCGEIIATITINRDRETIKTANEAAWNSLIERWNKEYNRFKQ